MTYWTGVRTAESSKIPLPDFDGNIDESQEAIRFKNGTFTLGPGPNQIMDPSRVIKLLSSHVGIIHWRPPS